MSGSTGTERILDAFLAPEADRLADRVIEAVLADIARTPQRRAARGPWRFPRMSNLSSSARTVLVGAVLLLAVGGATFLIASNQPDLSTASPPASTADAIAPTALPSPSQVPTPSTEVVRGWLTTSANGPGLYSWDGGRCAGTSCSVNASGGFMHNCYGSCDVAITIEVGSDDPIAAGATAVTIARHSGWYRRVVEAEPSLAILRTPVTEEWTFEIDGVVVRIRLAAKPGAGEAGLADAHAIIDSLRSEPSGQPAGFRLVFRITNGDWDSG